SNRGLLPLRQFHARRRRNQQDEQYTQHQPNFTRNGVTKEVALVARLPPVFPTGTETSRGATDIAGSRAATADARLDARTCLLNDIQVPPTLQRLQRHFRGVRSSSCGKIRLLRPLLREDSPCHFRDSLSSLPSPELCLRNRARR